jgi:type IV secretory pathway protease TraF
MTWWLLAVAFVLVVGVFLVARNRLLLVTVNGDSMTPDLCRGDVVLVRRSRRTNTGDIALLRLDATTVPMVKRVVAVAGEPVPAELRQAVALPVVPAGTVVIRGTTTDSLDSRRLGPVQVSRVVGVVIAVVRRAA